jgi:catalase
VAASDTPLPSSRDFQPTAAQWAPNRWTAEDGPALVHSMVKVFDGRPDERLAHRDGVVHRARWVSTGFAADRSDFAGFGDGVELDAIARHSALHRKLGDRDVVGMAVKLFLPGGEVTDLVAMTLPVFPVRESRHFVQLLDALARGGVRAPAGVAFLVATGRVPLPAAVAAVRTVASATEYRAATYHGVQTFHLTRAQDDGTTLRTPVRYRWVPEGGPAGAAGALRFRLELAVGDPAWRHLDDPTRAWPRGAPMIRAGVLEVGDAIDEPRGLAFNPLVLAPGIEPGDDDIFAGRAGAYPLAHVRRSRPGGGG